MEDALTHPEDSQNLNSEFEAADLDPGWGKKSSRCLCTLVVIGKEEEKEAANLRPNRYTCGILIGFLGPMVSELILDLKMPGALKKVKWLINIL